MPRRMVQREAQRGEGLAPSGRHGQGEQARLQCGTLADVRQHPGAQPVDLALCRERRHMRVKGRAPGGQQLSQGGPFAVRAGAVQPGVERLGVTEIGIDQAGKHHPRGHRNVKSRRLAVPERDQLAQDGAKVGQRCRGDRGRDGVAETVQPPCHAGIGAVPVGQAGMVSQDRIGDDLGHAAQSGGRAGIQQRRPGGRMIHTFVPTRQHAVEGGIVFAEVVEQPRHMRRGLQFQRRRPVRGQRCGGLQVIRQKLPVAAVRGAPRMGIVFSGHPAESTLSPRKLPCVPILMDRLRPCQRVRQDCGRRPP